MELNELLTSLIAGGFIGIAMIISIAIIVFVILLLIGKSLV